MILFYRSNAFQLLYLSKCSFRLEKKALLTYVVTFNFATLSTNKIHVITFIKIRTLKFFTVTDFLASVVTLSLLVYE